MSKSEKKRRDKLFRREGFEGWVGIMPWFLGFFFFGLIPILFSLYISFTDWDMITDPQLIGLTNYKYMFDSKDFWQAIKVTSIYAVTSIPLTLIGGLLLCLLLNVKTRWSHFFRTLYYVPAVISGVAVAVIWVWLYNPDYGLINHALGLLGIKGPQWIYSTTWALPAIILMSLWGIGGNAVIYLAGLQNIPPQLYEAAKIDGAGPVQSFFKITLPLISPTILFLMIMGVIGSFQTFTQAYMMTRGGPNKATLFYLLYLYNETFKGLRMGYGAALAWILAAVILICTLIIFKSSPLWVFYEEERKKL